MKAENRPPDQQRLASHLIPDADCSLAGAALLAIALIIDLASL